MPLYRLCVVAGQVDAPANRAHTSSLERTPRKTAKKATPLSASLRFASSGSQRSLSPAGSRSNSPRCASPRNQIASPQIRRRCAPRAHTEGIEANGRTSRSGPLPRSANVVRRSATCAGRNGRVVGAQRRPEWLPWLFTRWQCACVRRLQRWQRRPRACVDLTRRRCLERLRAAKRSSTAHPATAPPPQVCRATARGRRETGMAPVRVLLWRSKDPYPPAAGRTSGSRPGKQQPKEWRRISSIIASAYLISAVSQNTSKPRGPPHSPPLHRPIATHAPSHPGLVPGVVSYFCSCRPADRSITPPFRQRQPTTGAALTLPLSPRRRWSGRAGLHCQGQRNHAPSWQHQHHPAV